LSYGGESGSGGEGEGLFGNGGFEESGATLLWETTH